MKLECYVPAAIEFKFVHINVPNRYGDEDIPLDFPGLSASGKTLELWWDVDTGIIEGWPEGRTEFLHLKVTDEGLYWLCDANKKPVMRAFKHYVPHSVVPGDWGDYVVMHIDGTGQIRRNSNRGPISYTINLSEVMNEFEPISG